MQYSLYCDQVRCQEWGISLTDGVVFDYLTKAPTWATQIVVDDQVYWQVNTSKLRKDLPTVAKTARGFNNIIKRLVNARVIAYELINNNTPCYTITEKGKAWNKKTGGANETTYPPEQNDIGGANETTYNPSTINKSTNPSSKEEQAKPEKTDPSKQEKEKKDLTPQPPSPEKHGRQDINNLIGTIKDKCDELGVAYKDYRERQFGKHILTAKKFGEFAEKVGISRQELAISVLEASVMIDYRKGPCAGPYDIYQNYADVYNKTQQKKNKSFTAVIPESGVL